MRIILILLAALLAFYVYFVGYAAWFFFLQGQARWARAAAFTLLALLVPLIPAAAWVRFRTGGVLTGPRPRRQARSLEEIMAEHKAPEPGREGEEKDETGRT
ncbi:MAG: hypothetical protein ACNS63_09280 [Candidatus Nitrospinota bacterium M3_3B_026]